jgi:hypothetical protein
MITGITGLTLRVDLKALTDFGDTAVVLPLALVFFFWLLATHRTATGLMWLLIAFACNIVVSALKLFLLSCPAGDILRSPSGHTGFAILVYGSITLALAASVRWRWLRAAIAALGTVLVLSIIIARLVVGDHSLAEIVIGCAIGGISLAAFSSLYRPGTGRPGALMGLVFAAAAVGFIFHDQQVQTESFLRDIGLRLGFGGEACRYR